LLPKGYETLPMKNIILFLLLQLSMLGFSQAGSLDTSFDPGSGTTDEVKSIAIQSDGKIIIGGSFTSYNGITVNRIARLNTDGSLDTSFNSGTGANSLVEAIAITPDGKIIIAGNFTKYNEIGKARIARLNTDGSIDVGFNTGLGADDEIRTVSLRPDGKIIVGGAFFNYNGTFIMGLVCLNPNGSIDTSFNPNSSPYRGFKGTVCATKIQSDGKIIVGGYLSLYNGTPVNRIARLNADGTLDSSFKATIKINTLVFTAAIQSDGKIVIGGDLEYQQYLTRLNVDGTLDIGFKSNGAPNIVDATLIQPDGKIIIGGLFKSYDGVYRQDIARLNADGTLDTNFNPGDGVGPNYSSVKSMALQTDWKIVIGGTFASYDNISRNGIARVNTDLPMPTASPQVFCNNATVADLVASGTDLKWYVNAAGGSALAPTTGLTTGNYYVSQTLTGIESGRIAVTVTINAPVTPAFTPVDAICQGAALAALPLISNNNIAGTWLPALDNTATTTYTFTPTTGSCVSKASMTITVKPTITTTFAQVDPVCLGTEIILSNTSDNGVVGIWSPAIDNTKTATYTFAPTSDLCATSTTMKVEVNALPVLDSDSSNVICSGGKGEVILDAGLVSGTKSDYSYQWFKDEAPLTPSGKDYNLPVESDGTFICTVKDIKTGCESSRANTVVYSESAAVTGVAISDLSEHNSVTVTASGNPQYSLDNPDGPFLDSNVFTNVEPGIHTVYVNDKKGCGIDSREIAIVGAPAYFTPNGDGYNDTWKLNGVNAAFNKGTKVSIFDRYSKLIKELSNAETDGWDGTLNGYPLPADDYWFVATMEDGRVARGHFSLKR